MAGEWEIAPLGELYYFSSGLSKPREEFGFGHGFLSFKDVFYNYFAPEKLEQLVNSTEKEQQSCSIQRGDVFLTRTSETMDELGMSCVALKSYERATFNGFTKRLRPKGAAQIVPEYAGYYFRSPSFRREVTAMSSLSTRASLNNEMLGRLKMVLPPVATQEAIGSILKALDDKIELNRRMNATLEAMARALFQSWFVDFDPVRAKLDGRKPSGIDADTAALFPSTFIDSELGPIPFGWELSKLKDLTSKIGSGATPRGGSEVYVDEGVALIRSQNIYDHEFHWSGLARLTEKSATELRNVEVLRNDVLINITGDSILRTCVVDPSVLPARVNQHVAIIRAREGIPPRYLHLYLVQDAMKSFLIGMSAGATRHAITKGHLECTDVLKPSAAVLAAFDKLTAPWFERIDANRTQSRTLATLRDTLLPKLLSGELSVAGGSSSELLSGADPRDAQP
jgi:type I restriction enzyme S subunit